MATKSLYSSPNYFIQLGRKTLSRLGIKPSVEDLDAALIATSQNGELFRTTASRLVDLFPNELIIQQKTITIVRKTLFARRTETLPVKDIGRVVLYDTPLLDGLHIYGKNVAHDLQIKGLYPQKARKAKEIIDCLLLQEREGNSDIPVWLSNEERSEHHTTDKVKEPQK